MSALENAPVVGQNGGMDAPIAFCTWLLIGVTVLVSYLGFRNPEVEEKYIFRPESILADKEYYRLVTSAFLHAGWTHLLCNMVSLYFFAGTLEWAVGRAQFLLIYFGAVIGGNLLSLYVHRHHEYLSYGASGGVCGIIFAYILLFPGAGIRLYLAIPIPGWVYAIGFMVVSFAAMTHARDHIGHDAHMGGAIVGLLIAAGLHPEAVVNNLRIFLIVLGLATALLVYLWLNPLLLPLHAFYAGAFRPRERRPKTKRKPESMEVDAILDKIARSGTGSLTAEERATLEAVSGKLRRRAESQKPKSDLPI